MEKDEKNIASGIGECMLFWMTGIVVLTPILFALGISISYINVLFPLIMTALLLFLSNQYSISEKVIMLCISIGTIIIIVLSCGAVFDQTWDGGAYHKTAVGLLKEGWNPLYNTAIEFNERSGILPFVGANPIKYAEGYPKASWYLAASIYYITGNIESGKAYTLIFAVITCLIIYGYFRAKEYSVGKCILLSLMAGFHPMVLAQMHSYYVDGMTGCILIMLMVESLMVADQSRNCDKKRHYFIVGELVIFGCGLKFSTLGFTALICIITFLFQAYYSGSNMKFVAKLLAYYAGTAGFSIVVVGAAPYVTNIHRYRDIFYGFSNMMDPSVLEASFGIAGLGKTGRMFASLFGKMSHGSYQSLGELLKLPFTYDKSELDYYSFVDLRVSGSGMFFSGILLLSLAILAVMAVKGELKSASDKLMLCYLVCIAFELIAFEETYQIRYISHIYIVVIYAFELLWRKQELCNRCRKSGICVLSTVITVFMCLNGLPWVKPAYDRIDSSITYRYELEKLAAMNSGQKVTIAFWSYDFSGMHFNLADFGIRDYEFVDMSELTEINYTSIYGNWVMYY
uniref:Glycosyltransferase RgtA/B/C/D-like domain-containing protein n=1 Tax=Eubacterium plexicaudatum ASF492 TaxID=1235802 RepID=N2AL62_9FIRM